MDATIKREDYIHDLPNGYIDTEKQSKTIKRAIRTINAMEKEIQKLADTWLRIFEQWEDGKGDTRKPGELPGAKLVSSKVLFNMVLNLAKKLETVSYRLKAAKRHGELIPILKVLVPQILARDKGTIKKLAEMGFNSSVEGVEAIIEAIEKEIGIDTFVNIILEAALTQVLKDAGYQHVFKSTDGVFLKISLLGHSIVLVDDDPEKKETKYGIKLRTYPIDRVYVNTDAVQIRGTASGRNVRQIYFLENFDDYDQFKEKYPKADIKAWGNFPADISELSIIDRDSGSFLGVRAQENGTPGQCIHGIDLEGETCFRAAGASASVFHEEKKFPFQFKNGIKYIPAVEFFLFPSAKGFHKTGMGHFASQLCNVDSLAKNGSIRGALAEINKIHVIDVANGKVEDVTAYLEKAQLDIDRGLVPMIPNEADENGNKTIQGVTSLDGGFTSDAIQLIQSLNSQDQTEVGLNMQESMTNPEKTATAIEKETFAAELLPDYVERWNAPEFEFMVKIVLDRMREIKDDGALFIEGVTTENPLVRSLLRNLIMDDAVLLLNEMDDIDVESVFTNNIRPVDAKRVRALSQLVGMFDPRSPLAAKTGQFILQSIGLHVSAEDLLPPPEQQPQGQQKQQPMPSLEMPDAQTDSEASQML